MINAAVELAPTVGMAAACAALGVSRATLYRHRIHTVPRPRPTPPRALALDERRHVIQTLNAPAFADLAPAQIYARLLDQGLYLCSPRTMYRILQEHQQVRERRDQLRHPNYQKPELLATAPNQLWSWDITKLLGPAKWTYYYLYVILDVYSRYVVAWTVAPCESAALAQRLIEQACRQQGISPGQLTLHADRGSAMTSRAVALLLADLGVTKTHSRPHVSNDNPFSEAHFKTLKYCPEFPERFGSIQDARAFCTRFFDWYNFQHYHHALALLTPHAVHYLLAPQIIEERQKVLTAAFEKHPDRFVRKPPVHPALSLAVWINPPPAATHHEEQNTPD